MWSGGKPPPWMTVKLIVACVSTAKSNMHLTLCLSCKIAWL